MNKEEIKCVICQKGILDNSHFINGKYYHNSCIEQLQNNWNELKEWLEEEFKANENWYNSDLTTHDRGYYKDEYVTIKHDIKRVQRKMQELESRK